MIVKRYNQVPNNTHIENFHSSPCCYSVTYSLRMCLVYHQILLNTCVYLVFFLA